jgi:putative ABC transport system permease protein
MLPNMKMGLQDGIYNKLRFLHNLDCVYFLPLNVANFRLFDITIALIRNYIHIAVRNFMHGKLYSVINVSGLAVGLTVVLLISIFIFHELSYDRFHEKADRIYRVATHLEMGSNSGDMTSTYPPLAKAMAEEFPEVEKAVRVWNRFERIFANEDKIFSEDVLYAGPEFFDVFGFKLLAGDPATALKERDQVVLTTDLVVKYFGEETDPSSVVGKSMLIDGRASQITGVVEDAPRNSYLTYKAIITMESTGAGRDETWQNMNLSTFLLLHPDSRPADIESKMPAFLAKKIFGFTELEKQGIFIRLFLQPLTSIHLYSNLRDEVTPTSSIAIIYALGSIAGVILLMACVNFMNLATARSANRAKEVGIRKVLGSSGKQLMGQFTFESILMVLLATLFAIGLTLALRYPFSFVTGKDLSFELLRTPTFISALFLFVVVLGIFAGSYPSFYLSSFDPVKVLKGKLRSGIGARKFRNLLVVLQFTISLILITCTIIVQRQLDFMRSKKLGFDKNNLLVIANANKLPSLQTFADGLRKNPHIVSLGTASSKPLDDYDGTSIVTEDDKQLKYVVNYNRVDFDYFETLKFNVIAGRGFSRKFATDSSAVVLNQSAADYLFGDDPIGKKIYGDKEYTVVGVVENFNFETLKTSVRPLLFWLGENRSYLHVRIAPGDYNKTLSEIETIWKAQHSGIPFSYTFADEDYAKLFREETRLGNIISVFTILAVVIACLGLFGLAAFTAEQRTKEISIRKVLGATIPNILGLLSKEFMRLILVSIVLSLPAAWYIMQEWLNGFAYHASISVWDMAFGSLLTLLLTMIIVSTQAVRAALLNPADTLKYE